MAKGKWAQGIKPRHFNWIIDGQLAVCERPGGNGANHRKVRRQEEIIRIRENQFDFVISLIPSITICTTTTNWACRGNTGHWRRPSIATALRLIYPELRRLLQSGATLLLRRGSAIVWPGCSPATCGGAAWCETTKAVVVIERILGRQMGPDGQAFVAAAEHCRKSDDAQL